MSMLKRLVSRFRGEKGQAFVEYAMVICLVAVVVSGVLVIFGQTIYEVFIHFINWIRAVCLSYFS